MKTRKETVGRLFRQWPKEATPQRLAAVLDDLGHIEEGELASAVSRILHEYKGTRAPKVSEIQEMVDLMRAERDASERELAERTKAARELPAADQVEQRAREAYDLVARQREVWEEGLYVPSGTMLGRILALMRAYHEKSRPWAVRGAPPAKAQRAYDEAMARHQDTGGDIEWWFDWKNANGWA